MIDLSSIAEFRMNKATLKETSIDTHIQGQINYQTQLLVEVINFDKVKESYAEKLHLKIFPMSNDALLDTGKGIIEFIEFKAGKIKKHSKKEHEIRKKIYDSVIIYTDLTGEKVSDMRQNVEYILVYNSLANVDTEMEDNTDQEINDEVQESPSHDYLAETFLGFGGSEFIRFGLEMFEGYCFRKVHTYTEQEFEKHISRIFPEVTDNPVPAI